MINNRLHIYRGIVVYNLDPQLKGRVKIYVPGIYPIEFKNKWQQLPWALPALLLGGGNWANERKQTAENSIDITPKSEDSKLLLDDTVLEQQNLLKLGLKTPQLNLLTGWCTVPHAGKYATDGAQVWVFFEAGDINKPIYFAAAQSGTGWFSEHPNQHVFKSDNIRVRIDELPTRKESTTHFDSYNDKCIHYHTGDGNTVVPQMNTLLDILIYNPDRNAVNIQITGNVNMHIKGNWYVFHEGNKHLTHIGNHYVNHIGDTFIEETGNTDHHIIGNLKFEREGNLDKIWTGYITDTQTGNKTETIDGTLTRTVTKEVTETFKSTFTKTVVAASDFTYNVILWALVKLNFK